MLKIIRKYQLIILAIGGSLLMVVFLFQPIIGKLSPDQRKATVAKLADGTTYNGFDIQRANFDLSVLKRVYPRVFASIEQGGLGLVAGSSEEQTERHWLLLSKQANDAGLIGDAGEGRTWIPVIAQREAAGFVQEQMQQGLITSQEQAIESLDAMTTQVENQLRRNVSLATDMMRGIDENEVYRTLATARGIERLYRVFSSLPAFSDLGAMHAAKSRYDSVAVDAVLVKADLFTDSIPLPSEDELQAFFDQYKADAPTDNDYRIGYTQPSRVKLGWLTLNKQSIEAAIVIDRVELNKIWRTDHALPEGTRKYPGDFAGERLNVETAYRDQRAFDILYEADKIIRSQVLQATRGLSKDENFFVLPDDWNTNRPTLEGLAQSVVDGLLEQLNVTIPLPAVQIHSDRWLSSNDISALPGFGTSIYRIGSRTLRSALIPQVSQSQEAAALLTIQPSVPVVNPAAEDAQGNRYYAIIYDTNPAGPADSIDDAGRDTVLNDYRTIKAYQLLSDNLDSFITQATAENDLAPALDAALALGSDNIQRPGVARNLLVQSENIARGRLALFVEPGLNTPEFRDAINNAASGIHELAAPESLTQSPIIIATPIPSAKGIGLAKVIAPRPMTSEDFTTNLTQILNQESQNEIREALVDTEASPFSLETMSERYGYTRVKKRADEQNETKPEADSEETESDPAEG